MINTLEQVLQPLIGTYNYTFAPTRIGVASMDWGYIGRFILLAIGFIMVFSLLNKIVVRMFGVIK